VKDQDGWIYHSLRREAERLILPNLPAFLEGKHLPADNEERLALLGVCQFTNRSLALANLYSDAFAAAPGLAEEYRIGHRFNAACAAARASNGIGADVAGLSMLDRAKWRTQAREWIRADLASCKMLLDRDLVSARDVVRDKLTRLRDNPDLAGLGDPAQLEHVSADDRKQFLALWNEIGIAIKRTEKNGR
jgi:serine/threonine-protein kinase